MNLCGGRGLAAVTALLTATYPLWRAAFVAAGRNPISARVFLSGVAAEWAIVAVVASFAFGVERLRPRFFHLRMFGWRDLLAVLAAFIAMFVVVGVVSRFARAPQNLSAQALLEIPIGQRLATAITAGIREEFMFRGFALEELGAATGSR